MSAETVICQVIRHVNQVNIISLFDTNRVPSVPPKAQIVRKVNQATPISLTDTKRIPEAMPRVQIVRKVNQATPISLTDTKRIPEAMPRVQIVRKVNQAIILSTADTLRLKNKVYNAKIIKTDTLTTHTWCWQLIRKDGLIQGFTNFDQDLTIDGVVFEAATGLVPTAIESTNTMAVDNMEVEGFLNSDSIQVDDLLLGKYDFAEIIVFMYDWYNKQKIAVMRRGTLGKVNNNEATFTAEIRGMLEAYSQRKGELYGRSCRANFGDTRCKLNKNNYISGPYTVGIFNSDQTFNSTLSSNYDKYACGVLTFTNGFNQGLSYEVKSISNTGVISLFMPATYEVRAGFDTFTLLQGCDKNFSTCRDRFANQLNFRGEPDIPGSDYSTGYAAYGGGNQ